MTQADRVYITPPTNTSAIDHPMMFPPRDPTRRRFLSVAAAGAMSIAAVSATALPVEVDTELVHAARDLEATDQAIDSMHRKYDEADSRDDYRALKDRRNENIATLITIQAKSAAGIQAKAASLRLRAMIGDHDQHQQISVSLADDLVAGIPAAAIPTYARANPGHVDPAFALIAEKRAADVAHGEAIDGQDKADVEHGYDSQAAWEANDRCEVACHAVNVVDWQLARIPPATLAGVAAVLRFANEIEDGGMEWPDTDAVGPDGWHYQLRATMAAAIEAIIRQMGV
jgi:hypothetical protein